MQQLPNLVVDYGKIDGADMLGGYSAILIDEEADGKTEHTAITFGEFGIPHDNRIGDFELISKSADGLVIVV